MWLYQSREFKDEQIEDNIGFVYLITNLINDRKYIGKKLFKFSKKLYRKTKNKKIQVESDWKTYYGSNDELNNDVKALGSDNFQREILRLCKSKSECNYFELREQLVNDALLSPELYYNAYIGTRISRKQMGKLCKTSKI